MHPSSTDTPPATKLKSERVQLALRQLPRWQASEAEPVSAQLSARFAFQSRGKALGFLNLACEAAETRGAHFEAAITPAWWVRFTLKARQGEALSEREVEVAREIERPYQHEPTA